jgi:hypothetical protein
LDPDPPLAWNGALEWFAGSIPNKRYAMHVQISEEDLSAFAALGEELANRAREGASRIMRTHHKAAIAKSTNSEVAVCVLEYASWALDFAASVTRERGELKRSTALPPLFMEGYFTHRFEEGDRPAYDCPKSRLPETGNATMELATVLS